LILLRDDFTIVDSYVLFFQPWGFRISLFWGYAPNIG